MELKELKSSETVEAKNNGLLARIHSKRNEEKNKWITKKENKDKEPPKEWIKKKEEKAKKEWITLSDEAKEKKQDENRVKKAGGGLTKVAGYKPVMGNNKFGYPSGGVPVKGYKGGGIAVKGFGRAFTKK